MWIVCKEPYGSVMGMVTNTAEAAPKALTPVRLPTSKLDTSWTADSP